MSTGNGRFLAVPLHALCIGAGQAEGTIDALVLDDRSVTFAALHHRSWVAVGKAIEALHALVRVTLTMSPLASLGLPVVSLFSCLLGCQSLLLSVTKKSLTVITLSNPILYPASLCKIRDLRPILIRIGTSAESTTGTVGCGVLGR